MQCVSMNVHIYIYYINLPHSNFKWNTAEWTVEKILNLDDEGQKVYFLM